MNIISILLYFLFGILAIIWLDIWQIVAMGIVWWLANDIDKEKK